MAAVVSKTLMKIEKQREESAVRALNVIITGLPPAAVGVSDKDMFEKFCQDNLTVKPRVVRTRRLGRGTDNSRPPKMCITLDSAESVNSLLESATLLRQSPDYSRVFLNRDLTKAQAQAAYNKHCRKRSNQQGGVTESFSGYSQPHPPPIPYKP